MAISPRFRASSFFKYKASMEQTASRMRKIGEGVARMKFGFRVAVVTATAFSLQPATIGVIGAIPAASRRSSMSRIR